MSAPQPSVLNDYVQQLIRVKARYLARQPGFSRSDEEDLRQEITKRLLERAHRFDARRASLNTFVDRVVASLVVSILREHRRQKRAAGNTTVSIDTHAMRAADGRTPLRDHLEAADVQRRLVGSPADYDPEREAAVRIALCALPPELRSICERLMDVPAATAARQLGLTRHQVLKAISAIRSHFRAAGLE
jgi:DNA-directed RNA polymerase specialized sigma24 family protein